jgi:hypothetical protein
MSNLPINLYFFLILVFFQGFLILVVAYFFIDRFYNSYKNKLEEDKRKQQAYLQAIQELDEAKKQAQELLKNAHFEAAAIVKDASTISQDTKSTYTAGIQASLKQQQEALASVTNEIILELKDSFGKEKISTIAGFNDLLTDFKEDLAEEVSRYNQTLSANSDELLAKLRQGLEENMSTLAAHMAQYEDLVKSHILSKSLEAVKTLTKMFFEETTTQTDHEAIIMKILEKEDLKEKFGL